MPSSVMRPSADSLKASVPATLSSLGLLTPLASPTGEQTEREGVSPRTGVTVFSNLTLHVACRHFCHCDTGQDQPCEMQTGGPRGADTRFLNLAIQISVSYCCVVAGSISY